MTDLGHNETASKWGHVDVICDEFERHWQAGARRPVEEFLDRVEDSEREALVRELILLEASYLRRNGRAADWEHYEVQFAPFCVAVREARKRFNAGDATTSRTDPKIASVAGPNDLVLPANLPRPFGHFELREVVGRGAFGTVYRAHDSRLHRDVAIKIPRPGVLFDEHDSMRFLREARAAGQLRHPSIITVHEVGDVDGTVYIASEFIEGTTLRESLLDGFQPTFRQIALLVRELALAVHAAHTRGIIHRDLKPANVLLDCELRPHIGDFGLARESHTNSELTVEGMTLGTPAYMSPEQADGRSHLADARSDIWSLGIILYELLTGGRPFEGTPEQALRAIRSIEPAAPQRLNRSIPHDLETICLKCLTKNPDGRYPSAQHLADDLNRWRSYEPISARPARTWERVAKWTRRNPMASASMAVAGAVAAVGLLYSQTRPAFLDLRVTPPTASVTLDGEHIQLVDGRILLRCRPGRHALNVQAADFLPYQQDVVLVRGSGNTALLNATLESNYGYVRVDSNPSGARVEVRRGGEVILRGATPFHSERLRAGLCELTLTKDLFHPVTISLRIPTGDRVVAGAAQSLPPVRDNSLKVRGLMRYRDVLALKVEVPAERMSLEQFVAVLSKQSGWPLQLDASAQRLVSQEFLPRVLRGRLGIVLRSALPQAKLTMIPTSDVAANSFTLSIMSEEAASRRYANVAFPVGEFFADDKRANPRELLSSITSAVHPLSWQKAGGNGKLVYIESIGAIVVSQTWERQLQVLQLMEQFQRGVAGNNVAIP